MPQYTLPLDALRRVAKVHGGHPLEIVGGGGGAPHNILDGVTHPDSVLQAVSVGSLIFGNNTPLWDELVRVVPGANLRNVLGLDAGDTVPAWKALLDAVNPAAIALAASPGVSLIASHRDHIHDHPIFGGGDLHTEYVGHADITPAEGFVRKTGAGAYTAHKSNLNSAADPGVNDDAAAGYSVGSVWINTTLDKVWQCVDSTNGAAVWKDLSTQGGGSGSKIEDADADTKVDVEEAPDEDVIRMDAAGTERFVLQNTSPHLSIIGDLAISNFAAFGALASIENTAAVQHIINVQDSLDATAAAAAYFKVVGAKATGVQVVYGVAGAAEGGGAAPIQYIYGLLFSATWAAPVGTTAYELSGINVQVASTAAGLGDINIARGLHVATGADWAGAKPTALIGVDIDSIAGAGVGEVCGLRIADQVATTVRLLELGPATPYLRLIGGADSAAGSTNMYLKEAATLKQVNVWAGHLVLDDAPARPDYCMVYRTTEQVIPSGAVTTVVWEAEIADTSGMWSIGDPSYVVIQEAGLYLVQAQAVWNAVGSTDHRLYSLFYLRGADAYNIATVQNYNVDVATDRDVGAVVSCFVDLQVGDKVYFAVRQYSGANLNLQEWTAAPPAYWRPWLQVLLVRQAP